jgi:hypothetical protein
MGTAGSHPLGDSSAQWLTNGEKACGRGASSEWVVCLIPTLFARSGVLLPFDTLVPTLFPAPSPLRAGGPRQSE